MLPDLHTGFSRGRSGGQVFPLDFIVPIKLTTTTERVGGRKKGKKKKKNKSKRIYRARQKIIINVFLESLLSESFPSLGVTVYLTSLGCPPTLC